ncbi:N-acetylmuramic acid 6-phosphate etherase [Arthrobacter sp. L77]|uniref:N-acetylmuramic acid 6-phosphate etherase n=1 Tax=Arthrobacter sp. L77 TaxID=1496689 RepID=UPI000A742C4E|nr:N-acetylmuramic acid 6-phosphate etherase [Arthrobacter sp. L77]
MLQASRDAGPLPTTPPEDLGSLRLQLGSLPTEHVSTGYADLDLRSTSDLVAAMNAENAGVAEAVALAAPAITEAVDGIADRLARGGRLLYIGAGTAGRLGILDASECPPTFGTDPSLVVGIIAGGSAAVTTAIENVEDDGPQGAADLAAHGVGHLDVVVGISASGRTPYACGAVNAARAAGALTIAITSNPDSPLAASAEIAIEVLTGPELVAGSTRLKAGTAQKLVLNMLSTLSMVRLGKTYGNIMIDLVATNEKLRARSQRTVMRVTGCSAEEAVGALAGSGGSVKTAVLMLLTSATKPEADDRLARHHGNLRAALTAATAGAGAAGPDAPLDGAGTALTS